VGAHRAQLVAWCCSHAKQTRTRTAISPSTRIGSPREEMHWTADIQSLLVTLLTSPYVRRARKSASTLSAPPQHRKPGNPRSPLLPIAEYIPTNAWSKFRVCSFRLPQMHVILKFVKNAKRHVTESNRSGRIPKFPLSVFQITAMRRCPQSLVVEFV
jgi:hypothetical protein